MPRQGDRLIDRLRDGIVASDPALSRLRLASRVLLSVLLTAGCLAGLAVLHPLPVAAYGVAVIIAFSGSMAIRDKTPRDQMLTRIYVLGAAIVAALAASIVATAPVVADIVFLGVIFLAVYVREFGRRWFAVGLIAVMSYFIADYLRVQIAEIGWLATASAIAVIVSHLVATVIFPDDPERDFRRVLASIDRHINLILRHLLQAAAKEPPTIIERKPLHEHLSRLRDDVMMAEGFIPQGEGGALATSGPAADLAIALFDLQLGVERMVRAGFIAAPPADLIDAALHHDQAGIKAGRTRYGDRAAGEAVAASLLLQVNRARARLAAALGPRPSTAFAPAPSKASAAAIAPTAKAAPALRVPAALRRPIQVTLASAIAMIGGQLLSPQHAYWAVIAAFIVFNNTTSRADTALRALQRSIGTFAGLIGGTIVATLLHGQLLASGVTLAATIFLAAYFVQTSYSAMIFFITVALAVFYGVAGIFSPELLILRLEETVIGAAAGTLVAFLVFPERASTGAATALDKYLAALRELVAAARRRVHGEKEPQHLLARSRILDKSLMDLSNAARPLGGPWGAVSRFGQVREKLLLLTGAAHWGRVLARRLRPGETLPPAAIEEIDLLVDVIEARIARAQTVGNSFFDRPKPAADAATHSPMPIAEDESPAFPLEAIAALLDRATTEPGPPRT